LLCGALLDSSDHACPGSVYDRLGDGKVRAARGRAALQLEILLEIAYLAAEDLASCSAMYRRYSSMAARGEGRGWSGSAMVVIVVNGSEDGDGEERRVEMR
jgi:hypothetical protein